MQDILFYILWMYVHFNCLFKFSFVSSPLICQILKSMFVTCMGYKISTGSISIAHADAAVLISDNEDNTQRPTS